MNYGEWILQCLGVYGDGEYLNKIAENFDVEVDDNENDMIEDIEIAMGSKSDGSIELGNLIAYRLYEAVIVRAIDELGAKDDDFDYYCNGTLDTWITCKGEDVTSWLDIERLYQNE